MKPMSHLRFGTAGVPASTNGTTRLAGVKRGIEVGFGCQELEFVHGVNLAADQAKPIKTLVSQTGFALTAHGPFYVNLNAKEQEKIEASKKRIIQTAQALKTCGGVSATFHAGFYLGMDQELVYKTMRQRLTEITETLKAENNPVRLSPETTGKATQFGNLKELVSLAQEVDNLGVCIDFSHLHARTNGKENSKEEFAKTLQTIENGLGSDSLKTMHIHLSGIEYGEKGERKHLMLNESDLRWKDLLTTLKEHDVRGCVICESPVPEQDAQLLQKTYGEL